MSELPTLHVGDHVHDRDSDDAAPMLVVGTPASQADEYVVDGEGKLEATVADYNAEYPTDDAVVEVSFAERTTVDIDHAPDYAYPRSRLVLDEPIHDVGDEDDEAEADTREWVEVEHDGDESLPTWDDVEEGES